LNEILEEIKKSIVFFGVIKGDRQYFTGTGCVISLNDVFHLVTAKHVVINPRITEDLCIFVNDRDGHLSIIEVSDIKDRLDAEWIVHENMDVDLAIIPFPISVETSTKRIQRNLISGIDQISLLDDVFYLEYQPDIEIDRVDPIIRIGSISFINKDKSFYIDGTVFPGNSGSPVFMKPAPYFIKGNEYILSPNPLSFHFIGIISSYIPYEDRAVSLQTMRERIIFEENTGLSRVFSSTLIDEIGDLDRCRRQSERIRDSFGKKTDRTRPYLDN
jgi:V8-like Glu-specific endopeptidase